MKIALTILGEPASKGNQRQLVTFGRGEDRRPALIKSKKALAYERDALKQIPRSLRLMLTGPVRVTMTIFYASERPDLDESVVLDVLQTKFRKGSSEVEREGVYLNDRQVREKHVYHAIDNRNPRAEIEVEEMHSTAPLFATPGVITDKQRASLAKQWHDAHAGPFPTGNPF